MKKTSKIIKRIPVENNPDVNQIKVEVYYDKGGPDYYSGGMTKRGLYLNVKPIKLEDHGGYVTETFMGFSGYKMHVLEMGRFNQKKLNDYMPTDDQIDRLVKGVIAKNELNMEYA